MRPKITLIIFAGLLIVSTSVSFLGYRYLSLASEFRERNFIHLATTQDLSEFLTDRSQILPSLVEPIRSKLEFAVAQAEWCLTTLSDIEVYVFEVMGVGRALQICRDNVEIGNFGKAILDDVERSGDLGLVDLASPFDPIELMSGVARQMVSESRSFQPFVTIIEDNLKRIVVFTTVSTGLATTLIFAFLARQMISSVRDQASQTRELSQLAAIAQRANDSILVTDIDGYVTWCNPAFQRLSGYTMEEMIGCRPGSVLQGPNTDDETVAEIRASLESHSAIKCDILNYKRSGEQYWISLSISPIHDKIGSLSGFVAISSDVTESRLHKKELEKAFNKVSSLLNEVEYQANHDPLTYLPNRRYIDDILQREFRAGLPPRILIHIDLDHFKNINDTLGHAAGDEVLKAVARILRSNIRESDVVGRIGGDEFIIALSSKATNEQAVKLSERLCREIGQDIPFEDSVCKVGASFGIASAIDGLIGNNELLVAADAALYVAKNEGRNKTQLYTPELHAAVNEHRFLAKDLERALNQNEFEAFFQPQLGAHSEQVVGVEALARWRHPEKGILAPSEFMKVAQELNIIAEIDRQIFDYGLNCVAKLNGDGFQIPKISFNTDLERLCPKHLRTAASQFDLGSTRIALEVLETVLFDEQGEYLKARVNELRSQDFSIELDDFGSGHASVVALQWLNPDYMKIDQQLVFPIDRDDASRKLTGSIIEMGKALGIRITAEGVETRKHATILRQQGCDVFQGFYYARPMSADDLTQYLLTQRLTTSPASCELHFSI
jgi:diguanylate cyclase (GGDEF)-like protein/PAS domain S-box-containing protein